MTVINNALQKVTTNENRLTSEINEQIEINKKRMGKIDLEN